MPSAAQIEANRAIAKSSTGPITTQGRAVSSRNSMRHGLSAIPNTLFASDPEAQNYFALHIQKLRKECLPEGTLEAEAFRRYVHATFQINRAQDRWINEPNPPRRFSQMERFFTLSALRERRADKALNKLQRDRFADLEVQGEIYAYGKELTFSKVLPSASLIAISLLATTEAAKQIPQTKPIQGPNAI